MQIKIYQNYYLEEHKQYLDPAFVPHDNTENKEPELREYPILKKLQQQHISDDLYWGLVSWRWHEKVDVSGEKFIQFVKNNISNSENKLCHLNYDIHTKKHHKNIFIQGEVHHKGILRYFERLSYLMGWKYNFHLPLQEKYYITCHFYVMHAKLWTNWIQFLDDCLKISYNDESLNYFLKVEKTSRYGTLIPNFSFVVERLITVFCVLNDIDVIEYHESNKHVPSVLRR